jgi:hypothetical protein
MDNKLNPETDAKNETAPTAPAGALDIDTVTGTSDKDKLKNCYFVVSGTVWYLYNKNGVLLTTGNTNATTFTFDHDAKASGGKITWTITNFSISTTAASGSWSNNDSQKREQGGSFQASSGGAMEEGEATSAASAK